MPDYVTPNALGLAQDELARQLTAMSVSGLQQYQGKLRTVLIGGIPHAWQPNPPAEGPPGYPAHTSIGGYWVPRPGTGAPGTGGVTEERVAEIEAARPVYTIPAHGSAQAAINAAPAGGEADLTAGQAGVTESITTDGMRNIRGAYWLAPIQADASLESPLMVVRPPDDGHSREGFKVSQLALLADASGQTALEFDLQGNRKMNRALIDNNYLRSYGGWALDIVNESNNPDAFATSTISNNSLQGGVRVRGGGDSLNFIGNGFYGEGFGIDLSLISQVDNAPGIGDSSKAVFIGNNGKANLGYLFRQATRPVVAFNNYEDGAGPGTDGAMLNFRGAAGARIEDAYVVSNFLAAPYSKHAVRLGTTDRAYIAFNSLAVAGSPEGIAAGNACISISVDASNTIIGPNRYEGPAVSDNGVGTMGLLKELPLGAGTAAVAGEPVTFYKRPDGFNLNRGIVELYGAVACPNAAHVIGVLPYGYRPNRSVWAVAFAQDTASARGTVMLHVDAEGNVILEIPGAGLGAQLSHVELNGIRFTAPLV